MKKQGMKAASGRVTPTDIKTPTETYDAKMKICGGMPKELKIDQIDAVNLPSGRKTAPQSVGF